MSSEVPPKSLSDTKRSDHQAIGPVQTAELQVPSSSSAFALSVTPVIAALVLPLRLVWG